MPGLDTAMMFGGLFTDILAGGGNLLSEFQQMGFDKEKINAMMGTLLGPDWQEEGATGQSGAWGQMRKGIGDEYDKMREMLSGRTAADLQNLGRYYDYANEATKQFGAGERQYIDDYGKAMRGELSSRSKLLSDEAGKSRSELLGALTGRYDKAMGMLEGLGDQERKDIIKAYGERGAQVKSDLVRRGMGGTTINPTMQLGVDRERTDAIGRLEERLRQQQLGTHAQLSGDIASGISQLGNRDLNLHNQLTGEWTNLTNQLQSGLMSSRANELGSLSDLGASRIGAETDLARENWDTLMGLRQGYGELGRSTDQAMLGSALSGLTDMDIRFPSYAGLSQIGGDMISMGNTLAMKNYYDQQANQSSGLFGLGGGAGAGIGAGIGTALGIAVPGANIPLTIAANTAIGYGADKMLF